VERILHSAIAVFARCGYEAVSMELIAEEAGVSRRTLYYAFPNGKDEIFNAAVDQLWKRRPFLSRLTREAPDAVDPREGLEVIGNFVYDFWSSEANITLIRIIVREPDRFPNIVRQRFQADGYDTVVEYLRFLTKSGKIAVPDPVLAARQFTSLIRDPLFWMVFTGESKPIPRKKLVTTAVKLFLEGVTPC
jgi:AcrR family transcriptional regulator